MDAQTLAIPTRVVYDSKPVLTTEQLAEFYGCESHQIKQNFGNNKERFVEGKHYFKLEGEALREFKDRVENFYLVGKNARVLYLWTKQGAFHHAKMLNTDRAWEVYEVLEENYFSNENAAETKPANPQDDPRWIEARNHSKATRRKETDVIKRFNEYRKAQGSTRPDVAIYAQLSNLANKAAGIKKGGRNSATLKQTVLVDVADDIIRAEIANGMDSSNEYTDILEIVHVKVDLFASCIPPVSIAAD